MVILESVKEMLSVKEDLKAAKKMAMGGKCRGMGAAKKGGSYSKNG